MGKWKRFSVQNTKGSIKRELAANGDMSVPELLPWSRGDTRSSRHRRHHIRCPVGVGAKTPLVKRPLTLPYTYSPAACPVAREKEQKKPGTLPPWAVDNDNYRIGDANDFPRYGPRSAREPQVPSLPSCPGASQNGSRSAREPLQHSSPNGPPEALLVGSAGGLMPGTSGSPNRVKKEPLPPALPTLGLL